MIVRGWSAKHYGSVLFYKRIVEVSFKKTLPWSFQTSSTFARRRVMRKVKAIRRRFRSWYNPEFSWLIHMEMQRSKWWEWISFWSLLSRIQVKTINADCIVYNYCAWVWISWEIIERVTWRQKALFDRKIASRGDFKWERDRYTLRNNLIHYAKKFKTFS